MSRSKVEVKKASVLRKAGNVSAALIEWGDSRALPIRHQLVQQDQWVETCLNVADEARDRRRRLTDQVSLDKERLEQVLVGAVAMAQTDKLGNIPFRNEYDKSASVYAGTLADALDGYGEAGACLAELVRHADKRYQTDADDLKRAIEASAAAEASYEVAIIRLEILVNEAKAVLKEHLPPQSPIFRHIKIQRSPRKPKEGDSTQA
jgi:hypothetical protein